MNPILFYLTATVVFTITTSLGLYYIEAHYSKLEVYTSDRIIKG